MKMEPAQLIAELSEMGISRGPILDAVRYVPRSAFVPKEQIKHAWENRPLPIGSGQTISQPYTVARMLELASVSSGERVLEVGGGSGYAAALIAYVVGDLGSVTIVEILPDLAARARETLRRIGLKSVMVVEGDGRKGHPPRSPYDAIIVSAQARQIPPELLEQLAEGGSLVMPVAENDVASLTRVVRRGERFVTTRHGAYAFVPLV